MPTNTREVVINACFGGFGVSTEAMKRLIAEDAKGVKVHTEEEYTGGRGRWLSHIAPYEDLGDGYEGQRFLPDVLYRDGSVYTYDDKVRDDPTLVRVVREMGDAANGRCAQLKIVEIPADVEYTIEEYDGNEHIAESHRTWGN